MYVTQTMYERYASFIDYPSLKFFVRMCQGAITRFENGKKLDKSEAPVVYGTTVKDFDEKRDQMLARIEMNDRGVQRDFIGIDWDLNQDDWDTFETLINQLKSFEHQYQTPIILYPTHSYPKKPRLRTVMFTKELMNETEYAKAVSFVVEKLNVQTNDKDNYLIKHNFNLPVINNHKQKDFLQLWIKTHHQPLDNELWSTQRSHRRVTNNKRPNLTEVDASERLSHSQEEIDEGLAHLSQQMKKGTQRRLDFDEWNNFFQFLHALARAEVVGSITHEDAHYILHQVAGGNREWEVKNIDDYERELPRVRGDEAKLKRAMLLSYYFGINW